MLWRDALPADHGRLVDMMLALYVEDPSTHTMSREKIERTLATFGREPARGRAVVLDVDGTADGYALLCAFWSNELGGEVCILDELYVSPGARGQGAASGLVRDLVAGALPWFRDA